MNVLIVILIGLIIIFIFGAIGFIFQKKISKNTVLAFTGGLGTGKTYLGVKYDIKAYKKQRLLYRLRLSKDKPSLYSNIPIIIGKKKIKKEVEVWNKKHTIKTIKIKKVKVNVYSKRLLKEHILMTLELPQKCTVLFDEIGQCASQYDFDNPNVMLYLQEFVRFYRHYLDGKMILTDQASSNIVVPIRRRINMLYNLSNFHRYFLFFYKVDVVEVQFIEESQNVMNIEENKPYFMGYLPFKYLRFLNFAKKRYDSRCYSPNYDVKFGRTFDEDFTDEEWKQLKTRYFIDISASKEERKKYRENGRY